MTYIPFRTHHLLQLLQGYSEQSLPLDRFIAAYFHDHPALGSKDRKELAETAYALIRWQASLDALSTAEGNTSWERRIELFESFNPALFCQNEHYPLWIRYSCPEDLFSRWVTAYGIEQAKAIAWTSNTPAPITIRANTLKISRDKLLSLLSPHYEVYPCSHSDTGIIFTERQALFQLPEFKQGYFEMQDEGSQLIAALIQAKPGESVLDFCAGSGGKTLAFAPQMQQKGQIFLHDIRTVLYPEIKRRLKRAGIQNAQTITPEKLRTKAYKKRMDWVLVDAPCSGSGTLRRNPDSKWRWDPETLVRLRSLQRTIFEQALSHVKLGGYIVYATCSILPEENEQQVAHFLEHYPIRLQKEPFLTLPQVGQMDGFFGAVFQKLPST